jgi:uncharacterized membrane protein YhfC
VKVLDCLLKKLWVINDHLWFAPRQFNFSLKNFHVGFIFTIVTSKCLQRFVKFTGVFRFQKFQASSHQNTVPVLLSQEQENLYKDFLLRFAK